MTNEKLKGTVLSDYLYVFDTKTKLKKTRESHFFIA